MNKERKNVIVGITGASGSLLAKAALEFLAKQTEYFVSVVITENAKNVFAYELDIEFDDFIKELNAGDSLVLYDNKNMFAPIASGSNRADCMIILPCSMATLAKIANGVGDSLLTRAADVMIKENRKLVIAPRESPLSSIHLKNMLTLSNIGVAIVPPVPAFYGKPKSTEEICSAIAGRILSSAGIENDLYPKWRYK